MLNIDILEIQTALLAHDNQCLWGFSTLKTGRRGMKQIWHLIILDVLTEKGALNIPMWVENNQTYILDMIYNTQKTLNSATWVSYHRDSHQTNSSNKRRKKSLLILLKCLHSFMSTGGYWPRHAFMWRRHSRGDCSIMTANITDDSSGWETATLSHYPSKTTTLDVRFPYNFWICSFCGVQDKVQSKPNRHNRDLCCSTMKKSFMAFGLECIAALIKSITWTCTFLFIPLLLNAIVSY